MYLELELHTYYQSCGGIVPAKLFSTGDGVLFPNPSPFLIKKIHPKHSECYYKLNLESRNCPQVWMILTQHECENLGSVLHPNISHYVL